MKKYVKPELFFESYELSQSIASNSCAWDLKLNGDRTLTHPDVCVGYGDPAHGMPAVAVFSEKNDDCGLKLEDYCYENGSGNTGGPLFHS